MPDFNDYYVFVKVVEHQGFSAAGRALDLPKSTLSRRVIELEKRLGVRLIQRNSRRFVMTEVGAEFHRHALAMLVEAEAADNVAQRSLAEPSGSVRFTCSVGMSHTLADLVCRFLARYPKVNLEQHTTNRFVDLIEGGFDVGLRGHAEPLPDSSLVQRRLVHTPWALFAAPTYLERAGVPSQPADLAAHQGLSLRGPGDDAVWTLHGPAGETASVAFVARLRSDDIESLKRAALTGLGIVSLPAYLCRAEVTQGELRRVLPQWTARKDAGLTLLMPSPRGLLPSVRAFIDFLVAEYPLLLVDAPVDARASPS